MLFIHRKRACHVKRSDGFFAAGKFSGTMSAADPHCGAVSATEKEFRKGKSESQSAIASARYAFFTFHR
jgi:hypothetical protein